MESQKVNLQPFEIDSSRMPVLLGSALRVPSYSYPVWGISGDEKWLRKESERQYEIEWKGGSKKQMEYVIEALKEAGMSNYSQMLRDANAELVSEIVRKSDRKVNYMELGAGVSTETLYDNLYKDGIDLGKIFSTLIEPSEERLEKTSCALEKKGLKRGKDFRALARKDTVIPLYVPNDSQDIASYVAVLHHHAYLDTPLKCVYGCLRNKGILVAADWHNAMWEHPNSVYEFLRNEFEWPTKEEDLDAFAKTYPKALEKAPELSELDAESNRHIKRFWKGWETVRKREKNLGTFRPEDDIWMLEAHRPVERQSEVIQRVGYKLNSPTIRELQESNPKRLIENVGILYQTIAQKTEEGF